MVRGRPERLEQQRTVQVDSRFRTDVFDPLMAVCAQSVKAQAVKRWIDLVD